MVPHDGQLRSRVDRLVYDNGWLRRRRAAKVRTMHPHCCLHELFLSNSEAKGCIVSTRPIFDSRYLSFCSSLTIFFPIVLNLSCPSTFETSRAGAWCRVPGCASLRPQQQQLNPTGVCQENKSRQLLLSTRKPSGLL